MSLDSFTEEQREKIDTDIDSEKAHDLLYQYFEFLCRKEIRSWKDVDREVFEQYLKTKWKVQNILEDKSDEQIRKFWNVTRDSFCRENDIELPENRF